MTIYTVDYRTRLEGWKKSVHILAESPYEAYKQVSDSKGRPIPTRVFLTNETDHVK